MPNQLTIVKSGSETVADHAGISNGKVYLLAQKIVNLTKQGVDVISVSSGAEKAGQAFYRRQYGNRAASKESLTTVGNVLMAEAWQNAFHRLGRVAGLMLITHQEINDPKEGPRFLQTLKENLDAGIITVVNENDAVNDEEMIEYEHSGDNDGLAFKVARSMGAANLILLTSVDGLLDPTGNVLRTVEYDDDRHSMARLYAGDVNEKGQGMPTKVAAAIEATKFGIDSFIAHADRYLSSVLAGETGTHFVAKP